MTTIGITTTVPIEVLLAAGYQPVDLNNLFISSPDREQLVNIAEQAGFPQNLCTWIKGIYGTCIDRGIDTVLCVTTGDCSNTVMLMEVFKLRGLEVITFAFPDQPDPRQMHRALVELAGRLGTSIEAAERVRQDLAHSRLLAQELDWLTWQENRASGWENHYWLVSTSDFSGDCLRYNDELRQVIAECRERDAYPSDMLRLAYIGVPSVFAQDLYHYLEGNGARVVFNEVQRQFAMPQTGSCLAEQYSNYTYPYSVFDRVKDIKAELSRRRVRGVIHYVQTFCHRGIADIIFRDKISVPILTLEGNTEYFLSHHQRTRIEAFLDLLHRSQRVLSEAR